MRYLPILCLGLAALFMTGCGLGYSGTYQGEMQLLQGKQETEKYPIQEKREYWSQGADTTLELKSNGRYAFTNADFIFEGDWWVAEKQRIAVRRDTQNGNRIHPKLRKEVDKYYTIRPDKKLSIPYGPAESNLEIVFTKQ